MSSPGTVSKILWHFTGGPFWDEKLKKQSNKLKDSDTAFGNLISILKSKEIWVGKYSETAKFKIRNKYCGRDANNKPIFKDRVFPISTSPVCCVADIPLIHIKYHSKRYGEFAIGFHRNSIINHGFNPVLYTLENSDLSNTLFNCQDSIEAMDLHLLDKKKYDLNDILERLENLRVSDEYDSLKPNLKKELDNIFIDLDFITHNLEFRLDNEYGFQTETIEYLKTILSYVKTFTNNEFETIYCEREWRTKKTFQFEFSDIANIVVPKKGNYYENLCDIAENDLKLPRNIAINSWEDLIEH